jgi:hypothetical protein
VQHNMAADRGNYGDHWTIDYLIFWEQRRKVRQCNAPAGLLRDWSRHPRAWYVLEELVSHTMNIVQGALTLKYGQSMIMLVCYRTLLGDFFEIVCHSSLVSLSHVLISCRSQLATEISQFLLSRRALEVSFPFQDTSSGLPSMKPWKSQGAAW